MAKNCIYYLALTCALCLSLSNIPSATGTLEFLNVRTINASFPISKTYSDSKRPPRHVTPCLGSMHIDVNDDTRLLIGMCVQRRSHQTAAIGYVQISDPGGEFDERWGKLNTTYVPEVILHKDGIGNDAVILNPEYFYQHKDGDTNRILFIDRQSCLRQIDLNTNQVSTLIGSCLKGEELTIHINSVQGFTYLPKKRMFVFSIVTSGTYIYHEDDLTTFHLAKDNIGHIIPDDYSTMVRGPSQHPDDLWQKNYLAVSYYNTSMLDAAKNIYEFQRKKNLSVYLSAPGGLIIEPDSKYWTKDEAMQLEGDKSDLVFHEDGVSLVITQVSEHNIGILDTSNRDFYDNLNINTSVPFRLIGKGNDSVIDGDVSTEVSFTYPYAAVWLSRTSLLVSMRYDNHFRILTFKDTSPGGVKEYSKTIGGVSVAVIAVSAVVIVIVVAAIIGGLWYKKRNRDNQPTKTIRTRTRVSKKGYTQPTPSNV